MDFLPASGSNNQWMMIRKFILGATTPVISFRPRRVLMSNVGVEYPLTPSLLHSLRNMPP